MKLLDRRALWRRRTPGGVFLCLHAARDLLGSAVGKNEEKSIRIVGCGTMRCMDFDGDGECLNIHRALPIWMTRYPIDGLLLTRSFPGHSAVGINVEADYYRLLITLQSTSSYDELLYCDWPSNYRIRDAKDWLARHPRYKHLGLREKRKVIKELAKGDAARLALRNFGEKQAYEDEQELTSTGVGEDEDVAKSSLG